MAAGSGDDRGVDDVQGRDLATWVREAKATDREAFVARHPYPFFVLYVTQQSDAKGLAFRTEMAAGTSSDESAGALLVCPIVKSPGSPYSDRVSIGRARNCDVVLRHPSVSKLHAHVRTGDDGALAIVDVGSHNGTRVDGQRLPRDVPCAVKSGAHVRFGEISGNLMDAASVHAALSRMPSV